jgi:hypothetical protein
MAPQIDCEPPLSQR